MHDQFEITSFLHNVIGSSREGRVHLIGKNNIEWCLDIVEGRLVFAAHSLQYLTALDTVLPKLGYEAALPIYWRLMRTDQYKYQKKKGTGTDLEALTWTSTVVGALIQYNALSLEQAEKTLAELAENAVDALLGLEVATVTWSPVSEELWYLTARGIPLFSLIKQLSERQRAWQPLSDRIASPHQRPYCETPEKLYQHVPQGLMSHQMLNTLTRLMQGASIRQLAQTVKQDEIKLAKLLYPYIQHRVIKLWPPVQPFDRLPWLPSGRIASVANVMPTSSATVSAGTVYKGNSSNANKSTSEVLTNQQLSANHSSRTEVLKTSDTNTPPFKPSIPTQDLGSHSSGIPNLGAGNLSSGNLGKATSRSSQSRYLIICIDDSQAMLEKIESYLDPEYFELKTIIDPVASVSKICAMKPDLVLMDISMPNINGNSLCQILKRSYLFKDVPIIMISSNTSPLNKATAQSSGATDYLEKPFSKAQLMQVLGTYLETQFSS